MGGIIAVTQVSNAGTDARSSDLYNTYDAIALAEKIPNDQGPDPECSGTAVAAPGGVAHNHNGNAGSSSKGQKTGRGKHSATPSASASSVESPVPARCHEDLGGPFAQDFVDILRVASNVKAPKPGPNASTGTFSVRCGRNEEGRHNSDNVIVAPGVVNGAHHVHDYVGNDSTSGASTDESLAAAGTTCTGGDLSTYYWPVLRAVGKVGPDADQDGGGKDGNVGKILTASSVQITYKGSPASKVVAMPRFLRIITGDAKAFTNGPANANAKWTCTGFEDRVTTKYPLCPQGSKLVRIADFQNCWDGQNTDSANHRSHIVFQLPDGTARCPMNTVAVPQLSIKLEYNVPPGRSFALDGFPEQMHNPITDHNDFINVMPDRLMAQAVECINSGRRCR